jgi:hypothetical protein
MAPVNLLVSLLVFAAPPAFAEESSAPPIGGNGSSASSPGSPVTRDPEREAEEAKGIRAAKAAKALPTRKELFRPLPDSLKERCGSQSGKSWDSMTPDERVQASRVRVSCSGF